ncbi:unnamed protein product [Aphanomyces euteiches]
MQLAHNHPLHHENVQRRHNGVSHNKVVRSVLESEAAGKDARKLTANDIKDCFLRATGKKSRRRQRAGPSKLLSMQPMAKWMSPLKNSKHTST